MKTCIYKNLLNFWCRSLSLLLLIVFYLCLPHPCYSQNQSNQSLVNSNPLPKQLIIKLNKDKQEKGRQFLNTEHFNGQYNQLIGKASLTPAFPGHQPIQSEVIQKNPALVDLSLFYHLRFQNDFPLDVLIFRLQRTGLFEYIEPVYPVSPLFMPNDQKLGSQYYLTNIQAYQAWDICQGDTNTVIGIVDSGTDLDHPDLMDNLKYNYNDPIDGVDNDNDGFVDNFRGWDMGDMDNDPQVIAGGSNPAHGVHMCGIATASTNNNTGVAGVGFKCKFLPVKINDVNNQYVAGYEGIVYAADHGCKVINCSWGGQQTSGQFGQDIINYATFNKDALVVAACGNSNSSVPFYPASYDNVLSVAATGSSDERMFVNNGYASSYGYYVDVCAPGAGIFNTWDYPYFYATMSGTSMACAVTSGAAALIRSYYPGLSALQTAEKIRATADKIDTLPANIAFYKQLGTGRINILRALTDTSSPGIRISNVQFTDGNDSIFEAGDTIQLRGEFHNYLAVAHNLKISIIALTPGVQLMDTTFSIPVLNASSSVINQNTPFTFKLSPQLASDAVVMFRIDYNASNFHSFEYIRFDLNTDYLNIKAQNIKTTLTSKGKIGFNDEWNLQGTGFSFKNDINRLFSGGFIVGTSYFNVSDVLYNSSFSGWDTDFVAVEKIHKVYPSAMADHEYKAIFNDSGAGSTTMGLLISHRTYFWDQEEDSKYIIHELTLKNNGLSSLANLYTGLFADWDMNLEAPDYDRVSWDIDNKLGITYSLTGGPYAGISLVTNGPVKQYAFDNNGSNGSINLNDGFTAQEKYMALKSFRSQAGLGANGNNVSDLVSTGPFLLLPGDSIVVAFGIMAAEQLTDLRNAAKRARYKYFHVEGIDEQEVTLQHDLHILPNPVSSTAKVSFFVEQPAETEYTITDIAGRRIVCCSGIHSIHGWNSLDLKTTLLCPGTYALTIKIGNNIYRKSFVKIR